MKDKEYHGTMDLAEASGYTREWIRQLVVRGDIQGFKVGRDWVIPEEEARRWLREHGVKGGEND